MIVHYTGPLLPECFLLLIVPNFADGVSVRYTLPSEQAQGLTGVEYRTPTARAIRHEMDYSYQVVESELADIKETLFALSDKRVAVPLWPDAFSEQADWVHAGQYQVGWNSSGTYSLTAAGADLSAFEFAAPLLIGRIKRPKFSHKGGGVHEAAVTVTEDSPYSHRIDPSAGAIPASFAWEPSEVDDESQDQLRQKTVGDGRESAVAGGDGSNRWLQTGKFTLFDRSDIGNLLRFFVDRKGSVKSFTCPAWAKPAAPSAARPLNFTSRFSKDVLEIEYESTHCAHVDVELLQEVATGSAQDGNSDAKLYLFQWEGANKVCLTSWEHALTYGGDEYTPAKITHEELRDTITPLGAEVDVEIFEGDANNPLQAIIQGEAELRLTVQILRAKVSPDTGAVISAAVEFDGEIRSADLDGDSIKGKASTFGGMFQRRCLRHIVQQRCNYELGDELCGLPESAVKTSGTMSAGSWPSASIWFTPSVQPPSGDYKDGWFASGWIEVTGTDGKFRRRSVLNCFVGGDGVYTLNINRPLPAVCDGQAAVVYAGCDGNFTTCKAKWANGANFGGFPFTPEFISTSNGTNRGIGGK